MTTINEIHWSQTCCGSHGEYAEHRTKAGGVARLKRNPDAPGLLSVCRFGPDNRAQDTTADEDGNTVPGYVEMPEAEALALLS